MKDAENLIEAFISESEKRVKAELSDKGNRYFGWISTYVPEEIIMAFGFLPYRITGEDIPLSMSKTYLSGNMNPFIQSCLEAALKGKYDFLNGIVLATDTDAMKRLYDTWATYVKTKFIHMLDVPKTVAEKDRYHYRKSIEFFIDKLSELTGKNIAAKDIKASIAICNMTRSLLDKLNNLRKENNPIITSKQFLRVVKSSFHSKKEIFNTALESLINKIEKLEAKKSENDNVRLLITGSFNDQEWFLNAIEDVGGMPVCEDLCTRVRYFKRFVDMDKDPLDALVERYIDKPPSARMLDFRKRANYLFELFKEFNTDGIIYHILKFDDPYLFEYADMKRFLDQRRIPVLRIETDYTKSGYHQAKTRIQAFVEILEAKKT